MNKDQAHDFKVFRPRPSHGWAWLILMAAVVLALAVAPALAGGSASRRSVLTLIICIPVALAFLILACWFPTMRYELDQDNLVLRYGPVLDYRIPLCQIHA